MSKTALDIAKMSNTVNVIKCLNDYNTILMIT